MSDHTQKLHNISVFNRSSPGSTPSASSASAQLLSSCRRQLPGTSPCAPVASFVVAGACLAGMVPWRCFLWEPSFLPREFPCLSAGFLLFKDKGANASSPGQAELLPANTASPKCWLSREPSSLNPLQPCLPGGGQRLLVVGKEGEYSTSGLRSHLWWRVRFAVFSVSDRVLWGEGGVERFLPLPGWCLSAPCPSAGQFWVPHAGTMASCGVGLCHAHCPFPAPLLLPASLGAHPVSSCAVLGKVLA